MTSQNYYIVVNYHDCYNTNVDITQSFFVAFVANLWEKTLFIFTTLGNPATNSFKFVKTWTEIVVMN